MTLEELYADVREGLIDTVIVAMVDMQGRLVGKRVTARFFVDDVAHHGLHACSYLLGCDVEMEPLPGYRLTSWETGYHDVRLQPDLSTLRRLPWLEGTACVLCDVVDDSGVPVPESPRQVLKRQVDRASAASSPWSPPSWSSTSSGKPTRPPGPSTTTTWNPTAATSRTTTSSRGPRRSGSSAGSGTGWKGPGSPWSSARASGDRDSTS